MTHIIFNKDTLYKSSRKMDITYKHQEFVFKDRMRYLEVNTKKLSALSKGRKVIEVGI